MKWSFKKILLLSCVISPLAYADAPVVDMTQNTSTAAPAPAMTLSLDQRVTVLERQLSAMNQIDLVNQVSHLEQQVQDLQGQVQVLSHTLQTVQTQTTSQYADLDKRLSAAATPTPAAPVVATDKTTANDDQALYDSAYKNIKEQKNSVGIAEMKKYLEKYPDGKNAPNAHYWLGQLYVLKGDQKSVKAAVSEFDIVIKKYPKSDKVKEANLKLGFAYLLQNKDKEAKLQFKKVMKDYPGTTTAQLAQARLAQLG